MRYCVLGYYDMHAPLKKMLVTDAGGNEKTDLFYFI